MLKVLIADDEKNVQEALTSIISLYGKDMELAPSADSVSATVQAIRQHRPDVVLLDIEMKGGTGFDVLKHFPKPAFKVIFVTAFQQHAVQAFRFSALDYLLKPVDPDQLIASINRAEDLIDREKTALRIESFMFNLENLSKEHKKIVLKTATSIHVVNLQDIVYCEADSSYTTIHLCDKTRITVSNTLGNYEEMFGEFGFIRIHSSYLLNVNYIRRYDKGSGGTVVLEGDIVLPVATRKKELVLSVLSRL